MTDRELVPTQSAYLELKAERAGMQEGYRFLDEKRLILAGEILSNLRDYEATQLRWRQAEASARAALRGAVGRHGLDELTVYPAAVGSCALKTTTRSVLGVRIEEPVVRGAGAVEEDVSHRAGPSAAPAASGADSATDTGAGPIRSPEGEACRRAFGDLMPLAARLALLTGNLERLRVEYLRTSRRARALEDVLLPEIDERLSTIDNALEELEREEAVRVRHGHRGVG